MGISDFERGLAQGLGRPLRVLQKHRVRPYREAILHACTHDLRYDGQCEDVRGDYLYEVIQATGEPEYYRGKILSALLAPIEEEAVFQMLQIARRFAQEGDALSRAAIYSVIVREAADNEFWNADELILLDGIPGLLFVVERYLRSEIEAEDYLPSSWVELIEEQQGKEAAWKALEVVADSHSPFAGWLETVRQCRRSIEERGPWTGPPQRSYAEVRELIAERGIKASVSLRWAEKASEEERQQASADLLREQDEGRLVAYLKLFRYSPFPGEHRRLIGLARSENRQLAHAALSALALIVHPDIRALAYELMQQPCWYGKAVELLIKNYQAGDYRLIEKLWEQEMDADDLHFLGMGVRHFTKAHLVPEAERSLLLLYEKGPCSICRSGAVDRLIALNLLPEHIRAECLHDAYRHTREAV